MFEYPLLLVFPAAMAFAAAFDLFTMTIPNRISLALVAAFCLIAPISGLPWQTIAIHVATGFGMLVVGIVLFARGVVGGGDAKLLAAASLWLGFDSLFEFLTMVAMLGGVLAVVILAYRKAVPEGFLGQPQWLVKLHSKESGIPYGVAISAAAMILYPASPWFGAMIG